MGSREEFDLTEGIVGVKESDKASAEYWQSFGASICVIKHGKEGSTAYTNDGKYYTIKPFPAVMLKGFGGGDGYGSAFLYSLLGGKDIIDCLEFGSASASILISSHSCSDAMPSVTQIEQFIKKIKRAIRRNGCQSVIIIKIITIQQIKKIPCSSRTRDFYLANYLLVFL